MKEISNGRKPRALISVPQANILITAFELERSFTVPELRKLLNGRYHRKVVTDILERPFEGKMLFTKSVVMSNGNGKAHVNAYKLNHDGREVALLCSVLRIS